MSKIYAVGDIQGCAPSLKALVKKLPAQSKMIFLGDLVNRGPDSLGTLRYLKQLQEEQRIECILGNHDLHLLAVDAGIRKTKGLDTVQPILDAPDRAELINWLRHRPMALSNGKVLTVHAGVLPQWDLQQTIECAQEVEKALRRKSYKDFLAQYVWQYSQQVEQLIKRLRSPSHHYQCTHSHSFLHSRRRNGV